MAEGRSKRLQVVVEAVATGLGLTHPALTPMPEELRPVEERRKSAPVGAVGGVAVRRVRGARGYDVGAPWVGRIDRAGLHADMKQHLEAARVEVLGGASLLDVVCDGTLWGWRLRMCFSGIASEAIANWDAVPGRTQAERLAVVERAIGELAEQERNAGGWTVTNGGAQ